MVSDTWQLLLNDKAANEELNNILDLYIFFFYT